MEVGYCFNYKTEDCKKEACDFIMCGFFFLFEIGFFRWKLFNVHVLSLACSTFNIYYRILNNI